MVIATASIMHLTPWKQLQKHQSRKDRAENQAPHPLGRDTMATSVSHLQAWSCRKETKSPQSRHKPATLSEFAHTPLSSVSLHFNKPCAFLTAIHLVPEFFLWA